jgi:hypothetical protein
VYGFEVWVWKVFGGVRGVERGVLGMFFVSGSESLSYWSCFIAFLLPSMGKLDQWI